MPGCPKCGFDHPQLVKYAGKTLKCPKCDTPFTVAAAAPEDPIELADPEPVLPKSVTVPSPANALGSDPPRAIPPTLEAHPRFSRGGGAAKASGGIVGGLVVLALIGFRVYSRWDRTERNDCIRFHDKVVQAVLPVEEAMKGLDIAATRLDSGESTPEEFAMAVQTVRDIIATGRANAAGVRAPSNKGAAEFLQAVHEFLDLLDTLVGKLSKGALEDADVEAVDQARKKLKAAQRHFADSNGLDLK